MGLQVKERRTGVERDKIQEVQMMIGLSQGRGSGLRGEGEAVILEQ